MGVVVKTINSKALKMRIELTTNTCYVDNEQMASSRDGWNHIRVTEPYPADSGEYYRGKTREVNAFNTKDGCEKTVWTTEYVLSIFTSHEVPCSPTPHRSLDFSVSKLWNTQSKKEIEAVLGVPISRWIRGVKS